MKSPEQLRRPPRGAGTSPGPAGEAPAESTQPLPAVLGAIHPKRVIVGALSPAILASKGNSQAKASRVTTKPAAPPRRRSPRTTSGDGDEEGRGHLGQLEFVATLLLAMTTLLTAWSAFQSAKWNGTQSIHFANASAQRTESAKAAALAQSQQLVDVSTFVSWMQALAEERRANPDASVGPGGTYVPDPHSLSGFLYEHFRAAFRPAVKAWLKERPFVNPHAAPTPFQLPEYRLAAATKATRLEQQADHEAALARRDNQRSDNYVLLTVLFASVLFFAGISSKLTTTRSRVLVVGMGLVLFLAGAGILATFPVQV